MGDYRLVLSLVLLGRGWKKVKKLNLKLTEYEK
jgi:hypothetical protein